MNTESQTRFFFDEFEIDSARRVLFKNGEPVTLNPKTFDLLLALIEHHGEIFSKNDLLDAVWSDSFVEEKNLSVHIAALRKALGERKDENRFIVTVPGKGYKFVAPLNHSNGLIIETKKIERVTIEEEFFEGKGQNEKVKIGFGKIGLYLFPVILLILGTGFYFWKKNEAKLNLPLSVKRLTTNGRVQVAVLSRDGKFFAFSHREKGTYRTEIRLGQINGSNDVVLVSMNEAVFTPLSFSADGSLYYVQSQARERDNGTLYKIPVLGGVAQKIGEGINIYSVISADEKQIAFVRNNDEKKLSTLIIADLTGKNERELLIRTGGGIIHPLSLAWSADGKLLAFGALNEKNSSREIFVAEAATGNVKQLTDFEWLEIAKLEWLKDNTGLLAIGRDKNSTMLTQIRQVAYPTGAVRAVTSDVSKFGSSLSVSADSSNLLAVRENSESNIWVAPAENFKDAKQITFSSLGRQDGWFGMDWTTDGRIVYTALTDQSRTIWIMNADGSDVRQLTPAGFQDIHLSVSPDGKSVVFDSNRSGNIEIWQVGTDGSGLKQLTFDGGNENPGITSDGKFLVYQHSSKEGDSVWRISLENGEKITLADRDAQSPRLSPDGKFVACGNSIGGKTQLALISIEGGAPVKLFDVPPTFNFDNTAIRWSPDGRTINYRDWSNGIWSQSIEGGAPIRLENLPQEKLYTYGWSPDGKKFAFVRGQEIRDVILVNNFK